MYICICFIQKDTSTNLDELNLVMASVAIRTNPENITKIFNYKSVVTDEDEVAHVGSFLLYHHNSKVLDLVHVFTYFLLQQVVHCE